MNIMQKRISTKTKKVLIFLSFFSFALLLAISTFLVPKWGVISQWCIIEFVNNNAVFDQEDKREDWYNHYRNNPYALTNNKGKSLDTAKVNDAFGEVNKHSSVMTDDFVKKQASFDQKNKGIEIKDHYENFDTTYIKLHTRIDSENEEYISTIINTVNEANPNEGIILDLREHRGGKVAPLLISFRGFLDVNKPLFFVLKGPEGKRESYELKYKNGLFSGPKYSVTLENTVYKHELKKIKDTKLAILIGPETSSAAEFATLALMTNSEQVKTFGEPSAGLTSKNSGELYYLVPNSNITIGWLQTKDGRIYRNDPIFPEIDGIKSDELQNWLKQKNS